MASQTQSITACAFIYRKIEGEYQVLLTQRSFTSQFLPGAYEIPGGHIDYGEDIVAGLKREIKEELNLEIRVGEPFGVFTYLNKGSHTIEVVYFATPDSSLENIKIQADEIASYHWITENNIDTIVTQNKQVDDPEIAIMRKGFQILANPARVDPL